MNAEQAIEVGMQIAAKHQHAVLEMIRRLDMTPEEALLGNRVWLATQIMKAMAEAERDSANP